MRNIQIHTTRLRYLMKGLMLCLGMLLFASCIDENLDGYPPETGGDGYTTLSLLLPRNNNTTTYAPLPSNDENKVSEIDLLVFKDDGINQTYLYRSAAAAITNANADGSIKNFKVRVANTEGSDQVVFVLIANARDAINAASFTVGDTKEDVLEQLNFASSVWNFSSFKGFPMWGEMATPMTIVSTTSTFPTIRVIRAVARVDIGLNFTDLTQDPAGLGNTFKLKEVYVYNSKSKGLVVPEAGNLDVSGSRAIAPTLPNPLTNNPLFSFGASDIDAAQKSLLRTIYLNEAPASSPTDRANATCIVIGGSFEGGATTYYRLDFIKNDEGSLTDTYIPVLRNHRYVFNITGVQNQGYATKEKAFSEPSINALEVKQVYYDESIGSITFNGSYMLALSTHEVKVRYDAQTVKVTAYTDCPDNWSAAIDPVYDWLRIVPGTGQGTVDAYSKNAYSDIKIEIDENTTGKDRTAKMVVTFGRMTEIVTIVQTNEMTSDIGIDVIPNTDVVVDSAEINPNLTSSFSFDRNYGWMDTRILTDVLPIPWGVPQGDSVGYIPYDCHSGSNKSNIIINYGVQSQTYAGLNPALRPTVAVDPASASWLSVNVRSTAGSAGSANIVFAIKAGINPSTNRATGNRTGKIIVRYGKLTRILTVKQNIPYLLIPKGFEYYDQYNNTYQVTTSLMLASTNQKVEVGATWYQYANVPENWNSFNDPQTNQSSPIRDYSCAKLNELNYAGYSSGWRLPTFEETKAMQSYASRGLEQTTVDLFAIYWNGMASAGCSGYMLSSDADNLMYNSSANFLSKNTYKWDYYSFGKSTVITNTSLPSIRCVRSAPELD